MYDIITKDKIVRSAMDISKDVIDEDEFYSSRISQNKQR